jgi:hypothetical protein
MQIKPTQKKTRAQKLLSGRILDDSRIFQPKVSVAHRGIKPFPSSPRAPALPYRMISGVDHAAVPNRHFRHFPADLRPRCSRSAAISVFAYILLTGDRVFDSRSLQELPQLGNAGPALVGFDTVIGKSQNFTNQSSELVVFRNH